MSVRGSGLLADELFLLAHDEVSGKPRLHPRVTGIGLGGGLLGELILAGRIDLQPTPEANSGAVILMDPRAVDDELGSAVLEQIAAVGRPRPGTGWLKHLGQTATRNVGERVAASGLVTPIRSRLTRREVRWAPVDMSSAAWPATRLRMLLSKQDELSLPDTTLAGFALVCGLGQQILWNTPASARLYLDYLVAQLPDPLRLLLAQTERAVGDAVMNRPI